MSSNPGVDFAIVGGGIMGTSLARELALRGAGSVAVFDKGTVGSGASGRTGALIRRHYVHPAERLLAQKGWETYARWPEVVGGDPVHTPTGLIVTVDTGPGFDANLERLRLNIAGQQEIGVDARPVTTEELKVLQPDAVWDDVRLAVYEADSGYVDAVAAVQGMARAAITAGAAIHEHSPVTGVEVRDNRVVGVRTAEGVTPARTVIAAAGPWINTVLAGSGVTLPIEAVRVQVGIFALPLAFTMEPMVYLDLAAGFFARPAGPGRMLIGIGADDRHNVVDPDDYNEQNDPDYAAEVLRMAAKRIPALAGARYLHGYSCLYDMSPDTHPLLGQIGPDGLYVMTGFSGAGFKKGPSVAAAMAELITKGRCAFVDLDLFDPNRFATGRGDRLWTDTKYELATDFGHGL